MITRPPPTVSPEQRMCLHKIEVQTRLSDAAQEPQVLIICTVQSRTVVQSSDTAGICRPI